jgi:tRNA nucleotidyltransferase (CCA-adding enzyme)
VDIALDDMNGEQFAQSLVNHMIQKGKQEGLSEVELSKYKFNVVKANSEKSKHLETATLVLQGQAIDFVNLRSESYTENSRVPVMEIGSPE